METKTYFTTLIVFLAVTFQTSQQQQCLSTLDLIFLVDGSNSMGVVNYERQKQSLNGLVSNLKVSDQEVRVGLVLFSRTVSGVIEMTGDPESFKNANTNLEYPDEETRLDLAIDRAIEMFNKTGRNSTVPKAMMVITDGGSTDPNKTIISANRAKSLGITIFSIGVTDAIDLNELRNISTPGTQVFITEDFSTLESVLNNATNRVCQDLQTTTTEASTTTQSTSTTTQPPTTTQTTSTTTQSTSTTTQPTSPTTQSTPTTTVSTPTTTQSTSTTTQSTSTTTQSTSTTTQPTSTTTSRPPVNTTQPSGSFTQTPNVTTDPRTTDLSPLEACFLGESDLWLVVDVSQTSENLSRLQAPGDFQKLKTGLTKLIEFVQDPRIANPGVRLGLVAYSETSKVLSDVTRTNSINETATAVQQLPWGVSQGAAALPTALGNLNTAPVNSSYRSYIAVVAPQSSFPTDLTSLRSEFKRLKTLGYTIVIISVGSSATFDQQGLQMDASGSRYFYNIPDYSSLETAVRTFAQDRLCKGRINNSTGLCAESGHRVNGVGMAAHPKDCDKYIQCYYDEPNDVDLGVVRNCPMGLHYSPLNMTCTAPSTANCSNDRCKEECSAYKMQGACGAYWECEDGVSAAKCCQQNYTFVPDLGCQHDDTCKDQCGTEKWCAKCQKKPNWDHPAGYDVMILGGNMWFPRPCTYGDFDVVDCDCTAPRDHVCPADRVFDFTNKTTRGAIDKGEESGIRVSDANFSSEGMVLGHKSAVHVSVNKGSRENQPFTLQFRFREQENFSPYGETLFSSGVNCGTANSLLVSADDEFIFAEVKAGERVSEVKVPLKGLNKEEFKDLVLSYHEGVVALSIKDEQTQYIATTKAPDNLCLSCGLDIGHGLNKLSFDGEIEKIAVYSCPWKLLY